MKNKMLTGIILGVITSLVMACNPKKEETAATAPAVDKEQIKAELQAMETAFADAFNARTADGSGYYAEDATSFMQNKKPFIGRAAISASIKEDLATFPKGSKISFTANEVFPSNDGNQVVEIGSFKVVDSTNVTKNSGNYISLFEKRDGKYVCVRDMGASDMPKTEKK